jgi:hypothetical protein
MSGGSVTDMKDRASVASLVAAGTALLGPILASTILLAGGELKRPTARDP